MHENFIFVAAGANGIRESRDIAQSTTYTHTMTTQCGIRSLTKCKWQQNALEFPSAKEN